MPHIPAPPKEIDFERIDRKLDELMEESVTYGISFSNNKGRINPRKIYKKPSLIQMIKRII